MKTTPDHRRLFFDDAQVKDSRGVMRRYHQAEKCPDNPVLVPDQPWERAVGHNHGTVALENGSFRMVSETCLGRATGWGGLLAPVG